MQIGTTAQRIAKEAFDRSVAAAGLLISAPIVAGCAAIIALQDRESPFFIQERPGRAGRPFRLIKLRTMRTACGADGKQLSDSDRLTTFGRFLRRASLDELPQLWNVLRGDLSLVGPRPLLPQYLSRYSPEQARRHEVKPGITGWAQVNGRNGISWDERLAMDVWYVDHWSIWLDVKILALTALRVLDGSGVSRAGHATMPEFLGSEHRDG